jgi:hypothetical protein
MMEDMKKQLLSRLIGIARACEASGGKRITWNAME